jgi:dihydrodipicolinate synthase/N-acetylneuraminate lyase
MASRIEGIFTPTLVPLDSRGDINETELRRYVSWLIDRGVHGLYPNGSSGEFTRFTQEERRRIGSIVCDEAHGRVPVLAGAAEANVKETVAACEAYAGMGARAVAIVSPFYYRLAPDAVYAYFVEIAQQSPIDITLYNIPMFASPINVDTVRRLAEFPRVVGIKDSTGDVSFMMRLISTVRPLRPDFSFLTGWEAVLAPMIMIGCDGGTNASSNAVPEVTRKIYELAKAGNYTEAMQWQYRLLKLFDAMLDKFEFPDGFKFATEMRGFHFGPSRRPLSDAQQADRSVLESDVKRALSDLVEPSAPPSAPMLEFERDQIAALVQEVVSQLDRRGLL